MVSIIHKCKHANQLWGLKHSGTFFQFLIGSRRCHFIHHSYLHCTYFLFSQMSFVTLEFASVPSQGLSYPPVPCVTAGNNGWLLHFSPSFLTEKLRLLVLIFYLPLSKRHSFLILLLFLWTLFCKEIQLSPLSEPLCDVLLITVKVLPVFFCFFFFLLSFTLYWLLTPLQTSGFENWRALTSTSHEQSWKSRCFASTEWKVSS